MGKIHYRCLGNKLIFDSVKAIKFYLVYLHGSALNNANYKQVAGFRLFYFVSCYKFILINYMLVFFYFIVK